MPRTKTRVTDDDNAHLQFCVPTKLPRREAEAQHYRTNVFVFPRDVNISLECVIYSKLYFKFSKFLNLV
jgi:hypothetical protein